MLVPRRVLPIFLCDPLNMLFIDTHPGPLHWYFWRWNPETNPQSSSFTIPDSGQTEKCFTKLDLPWFPWNFGKFPLAHLLGLSPSTNPSFHWISESDSMGQTIPVQWRRSIGHRRNTWWWPPMKRFYISIWWFPTNLLLLMLVEFQI